MTFLRLFDSPNVLSCYRRSESVMPQQALALANSSLCLEQARCWPANWRSGSTCEAGQTRRAGVRRALHSSACSGRAADSRGTNRVRRLSAQPGQAARRSVTSLTPFARGPAAAVAPAADPAQRARENLVHVLFNHNDFVTIR